MLFEATFLNQAISLPLIRYDAEHRAAYWQFGIREYIALDLQKFPTILHSRDMKCVSFLLQIDVSQ